MLENYVEAYEWLEKYAHTRVLHWLGLTELWLGLAATGQKNVSQSRLHLIRGLRSERNQYRKDAIPLGALLAYEAGDLERAVELLALSLDLGGYHAWTRHYPPLTRMHDDLKMRMPEAVFEAAWKRGKALDIEKTLDALQVEFA
ncbi:MAG: hypothetical protein H3C34_27085 [Caldilineaceae bacterium]|nr:hypothetical protein [Caldilineaceae bacterium]